MVDETSLALNTVDVRIAANAMDHRRTAALALVGRVHKKGVIHTGCAGDYSRNTPISTFQTKINTILTGMAHSIAFEEATGQAAEATGVVKAGGAVGKGD